jgi:alkyl hydroperoxide reductase subunit AhpC
VVKAYQQFKNRNFTILGVSLDKERAGWTEAIRTDKLTWTQVSDLKFWAGPTIKKYGVEAIPYNVLLDTSGRIIAVNLRGPELSEKLSQVLPK